jgi:hypothetical protein
MPDLDAALSWAARCPWDGNRPYLKMISRNGNRMQRFEGVLDLFPKGHVFDGLMHCSKSSHRVHYSLCTWTGAPWVSGVPGRITR